MKRLAHKSLAPVLLAGSLFISGCSEKAPEITPTPSSSTNKTETLAVAGTEAPDSTVEPIVEKNGIFCQPLDDAIKPGERTIHYNHHSSPEDGVDNYTVIPIRDENNEVLAIQNNNQDPEKVYVLSPESNRKSVTIQELGGFATFTIISMDQSGKISYQAELCGPYL